MGILYQKMGKHREALRVFRKLSGKNYAPMLFPTESLPTPSELLLHMAYSRYCMSERREALELINASAPQGADVRKSWEWLGTKAFAFKNMELAAVAFETALRFGTLEPASWESLAAVYKLRGFSRKAEECLMRVAARD
jgi:tetratricopeptide (TPR) repeat protein